MSTPFLNWLVVKVCMPQCCTFGHQYGASLVIQFLIERKSQDVPPHNQQWSSMLNKRGSTEQSRILWHAQLRRWYPFWYLTQTELFRFELLPYIIRHNFYIIRREQLVKGICDEGCRSGLCCHPGCTPGLL